MNTASDKKSMNSGKRFRAWIGRFVWAAARKLLAWTVIFLVWLGSLIFVAASASAMDLLSSLTSIFPRWLPESQYAKQKRAVSTQKEKVQKQKDKVRKTGVRTRTFGKQMITRNLADATTSLVPIGGGVASVGFAVADVKAACDLIQLQADLDSFFELNEEEEAESNFESFCTDANEKAVALSNQANETKRNLKEKASKAKDTVIFTHEFIVKSVTESLEILAPISPDNDVFCDPKALSKNASSPQTLCASSLETQTLPAPETDRQVQELPPKNSPSILKKAQGLFTDAMCYWSGNC